MNVFPKYTYEQEINLSKKIEIYLTRDYDADTIIKKIKNKINTILNFGQTPHKLFEEKHPKKNYSQKLKDDYSAIVDILLKKKN